MSNLRIPRRVLLGALAAPTIARAQDRFPSRPVTMICAFPAGGATDVQMRSLVEPASRALGQNVILENRPGAGSTLGPAAVARARPDGYLVTQMTAPALRLPWMQKMSYDPRTDFTPIIHLTGYLFAVIVRADGPYKTWADLVADARARPGKLTWGNTGANGTPHLTLLDLAEREKLDVVHVPFRGEGDGVPALLGGHVDLLAAGSSTAPMVDEGKLRWLNVWSPARSPRLPEVPTLVELGYPDLVVTSPYGLCGPAGMDPAVVRVLHDAFNVALHDPVSIATLRRLDQPLQYLNSADYARFMAETIALEQKRVEKLGLRTG